MPLKTKSGGYEGIAASDDPGIDGARLGTPAEHAGCLSKLVLWWTSAVTRVGAKRPLQLEDLWQLSPAYEPAQLHARFVAAWEAEDQRRRSKGLAEVSMFRVEWRLFWRELCWTGLLTILSTVCQVRKAPGWPRGWANLSLVWLHSHKNAWANSHLLGQPITHA